MFLQKIEIQGFKSFAQKTIIELPRPDKGCALITDENGKKASSGTCGVAAVVGPNGSGKSNVVDAVRWVLGEQSLKSLRGKKSEDVIFSGSEKKSRLGMASVTLTVNNEDGVMPIDYEQVEISRKLYRNGESEYQINKSKVRLQDVVMMLAQSNFGQKSYSIVSQGSIDRVIVATPAERKDYFDEAVGVKSYQIKRDQSINKLESAWNNLRQVDALLTEIGPRLNSLTRQVKRLEKREQVEKELKEVQKKYYGWQWQELLEKINEVKPKLEQASSLSNKKSSELRKAQESLGSLEKEESRTPVFNELQSNYQKLQDQRNKLREEQLILQNKIELAKERWTEKIVPLPVADIISRVKEVNDLQNKIIGKIDSKELFDIAQTKEDVRELGRLVKDLLDRLQNPKIKEKVESSIDPSWKKDLDEVIEDLSGIDKRLEEARDKVANFNQQEEQKKGKFFELQRQISDKQNEYNNVASQLSELRIEMARLDTRQQDMKREIEEETENTAWLKDYKVEKVDQNELHVTINKLKRQLELIGGVDPEVVDEYKKVKERNDFLSEQAEDLRSSINSLEKVIVDLDDKIQVQFDTSFKHINKEFGKFFATLFGGGKAELVLIKEEQKDQKPAEDPSEQTEEDQEEPVSILDKLEDAESKMSPKKFLKKRTGKIITGVDIAATPPGKKVSSINILSGGERSLASIALICAVITNNPSPFVILDEVDAALDEANSQRFAKIISELAHKTQFIVITHNRATMHQANILYGVTMGDDGISKLISLKIEDAEKIVRQ